MNRVTLIGRARSPTARRFVLVAADVHVPVEFGRPPPRGARIALEGELRSRDGALYVEALSVDVLSQHMV